MTALPSWANTPIARQLLAAIVQAPPELHVNSGQGIEQFGSAIVRKAVERAQRALAKARSERVLA